MSDPVHAAYREGRRAVWQELIEQAKDGIRASSEPLATTDYKEENNEMFRKDYNEVVRCPRCRLDNLPLGYPGALSRADNKTEICSACGTDEAMVNFLLKLPAQDPSTWPVHRVWSARDIGL